MKKWLLTLIAALLIVPAVLYGQPVPDSVIVESKTVAPLVGACGSAGLRLKVSITNVDSLAQIALPFSFDTQTGGAYGTLGRSGACARTLLAHTFDFLYPPGVGPTARLSTRVANYTSGGTHYNSVPRDSALWTFTLSTPLDDEEKMPPNAVRALLGELKFDTVQAAVGTFKVDSGKVLAQTIQFVRLNGSPVVLDGFVRGIVTVAVPAPVISNCPGATQNVLYGRSITYDFNETHTAAGAVTWSTLGPGSFATPADAASGLYTSDSMCALGAVNVSVVVTDALGGKDTCDFTITIIDSEPACAAAPASITAAHGAAIASTISGSDPDAGDVVTLTKLSGIGSFVNPAQAAAPSAQWTHTGVCANVATSPNLVIFQVADAFLPDCPAGHKSDVCTLRVTITNAAPSIANCPVGVIQLQAGDNYSINLNATDTDPGDASIDNTWTISGPFPAGFGISAAGVVSWTPTPLQAGPHSVTVKVTDACGSMATCVLNFNVVVGAKFRICIDTIRAFQGTDVEVGINNTQDATDPDLANGKSVGGFSFLISYDCACLQFLSAKKGSLLNTQQWEFFTYRFGSVGNGNCGSGCPSCLLRIVAIADVNNGGNHPLLTRVNIGQWAVLKFRVSNDRTLAGQCCPISWFWFDCTDNTVSDSTGNVLYVVDSLYTSAGIPIDLATAFPNNVKNCDQFNGGPGKPSPKKRLIFCNGAICVPTPEEIDDRGDLNLNGVGYEIADAVLYENYFIYGPNVLSPIPQFRQSQIAASDVNGDGLPLSVGDLVALIRVITGDANPLPKAIPGAAVAIAMTSSGSNVTLEASSISDLGGLHLTFKVSGTVGGVTLSEAAEGMTVQSNVNGDELSVLIFSDKKGVMIAPNAGAIFTMNVDGSIELVGSEAADYYGAVLPTLAKGPVVPTAFGLTQNYPNPFNAKTNIRLALPVASDYTVTVYNVAGQVVKTFSGNAAAGTKTIVWDGTDNNGTGVSSGVYFYKAVAGKFSATKKMLLLQ